MNLCALQKITIDEMLSTLVRFSCVLNCVFGVWERKKTSIWQIKTIHLCFIRLWFVCLLCMCVLGCCNGAVSAFECIFFFFLLFVFLLRFSHSAIYTNWERERESVVYTDTHCMCVFVFFFLFQTNKFSFNYFYEISILHIVERVCQRWWWDSYFIWIFTHTQKRIRSEIDICESHTHTHVLLVFKSFSWSNYAFVSYQTE